MTDVDTLLSKLDEYTPLQAYVFGHTPLQVSHFKTAQQKGSDVFDFWHQVLQLRSLRDCLDELLLQKNEVQDEIQKSKSFWPFWNYKTRAKKIPRLQMQLNKITRSIKEKSREAQLHYDFLKSTYAQFENLSEEEIFAQDREYWTARLTRQLVKNRLSRTLGVGEGEIAAVLALPQEEQAKIFHSLNAKSEASHNLLKS